MRRRGMTLAEILVCLAILTIVTVMIVSFAILMQQRVHTGNALLGAQQELTLLETTTENWLEQMSAAGASFSTEDSTLTATVNGSNYTLSFANGSIAATRPDGNSLTIPTEWIKQINFTAQSNAQGDVLFFLFVTCTHTESPTVFAINPRSGEAVGGSAP